MVEMGRKWVLEGGIFFLGWGWLGYLNELRIS